MGADTSELCCGCLAGDRKTILFQNNWKEQCFLQIIREIAETPPKMNVIRLCWECEANITRFAKFKLQVKHTYEILNDFSKQKTVLKHVSKLSIDNVVHISLSPESLQASLSPDLHNPSICVEPVSKDTFVDVTGKLKDRIKNEADYSDDDTFLSDNNKHDTEYKLNPRKSKTKVKKYKKGKVRGRKKQLFREIKLTNDEIAEERKASSLSEDYVNAMFRCENCIVSFPNEDDMKDHVTKKHELNSSKHKCSTCSCSFNTEVAFSYHLRRHTRRYECLICGMRSASKPHATNHYTTQHLQSSSYDLALKMYKNHGLEDNQELNVTKSVEQFPCEFCPKVFKWKTSLRKHLETHKIEAGQKRRPYCEPCKLSFTTTANLQKHVKTSSKHQIQLKLRKLKEVNSDGVNTEQIADVASRVNKQRSLFSCPQCDNTYQWRGNLLRHLHSHVARANGSLVCAPCDRVFASVATYNQHMRISKKHASENDFKYMCSDCGKKFSTKTKLREHVDWEHLKNYVHTCTDCQKVFKSHTSLYLHRQVVHRKPEERHLCDHCGKSFPNQTKLRAHILALHTRQPPHACGTCGARFSWHSCLSRHLRRVHTDKPT